MKNILLIILACAVLSACKKSSQPGESPNGKTHNVALSVNGFTQEYTDIKTNSLKVNAVTNPYKSISVEIYNSKGLYRSVGTSERLPNYGKIETQLPAGQYTLYYIGKLIDTTASETEIEDTFYKKTSLTVANSDVTQTVTLDRITAKLMIVIKDAIPSKAKEIYVHIDTVYNKFDRETGKGSASERNTDYYFWRDVKNSTGIKDLTFSKYLFTSGYPVAITIYCFDRDDKIFTTKVIRNVLLKPNKITRLSGFLFNGNGTSNASTEVKVDTAWSTSIVNQSF